MELLLKAHRSNTHTETRADILPSVHAADEYLDAAGIKDFFAHNHCFTAQYNSTRPSETGRRMKLVMSTAVAKQCQFSKKPHTMR